MLNLFRGQGGRLGFTIERDGFVSDVLDYAVINGLQPGCRIVQVCIVCLSVCVFVSDVLDYADMYVPCMCLSVCLSPCQVFVCIYS